VVEARFFDIRLSDLRSAINTSRKSVNTEKKVLEFRCCALPYHLFGDQVPNQIFPIKTLASVAPRHDDWTMHKLLPREVLFQAVNSVDQWLKSMLISKR
jgi:hypothetical protein